MGIREIITGAKTIAVVGLSDKPERPSYDVASYLLAQGFRIIPVNPMIKEWKGQKAYGSLPEIPEKVDIVDVFRRSEEVMPIAEDAIRIGAKTLWMQLGVVNGEAAAKARDAGLDVVMDRCLKIEHARLKG